MAQFDIFLSYRRQDAEAYAYMLYRDLVAAGYSVFYDHKSLGQGNYVEKINRTIEECKDVIVLLSKEALSERIYEENDLMHHEIAYALQLEKKIIGIMLNGFEDFPKHLPEDISVLPQINCLYSKMEYYDAMFERLTSGSFLISVPHNVEMEYTEMILKKDKFSTLTKFKNLPIEQKHYSMKLLLDLAHEFNSSPECMRLYNYLDTYDRNRGLCSIQSYQGVIPTDYATYLSFFETLYLILYTETLDISLVDEMYRFRFFAACNNPVIQDSELLPLGYQYPNILELYDMWSEHIRINYDHVANDESFPVLIPLFEYDLHSRYALYRFAMNPTQNRKIRFINRHAKRIDLTLKQLLPNDLELVCNFQEAVLATIPNNAEENLFEALTKEEFEESLENHGSIGLFDSDRLVGILGIIPNPRKEQNLLNDLSTVQYKNCNRVLVIDCILIAKEYRGYGIQNSLMYLAEFIAKRMDLSTICAVVSPKNYYSIKNFVKSGYQLLGAMPKYHSVRNYFVKYVYHFEQ